MDADTTITLRTGRKMPVIGLGTWQLLKNTAGVVCKALQMGYRMIDTSGDYGTQPGVGQGMADSGLDRGSVYLVTKVEEYENSYAAAKNNLRQLGKAYVDLLLIHRPPEGEVGVELWEGLIKSRQDGLTKDIGVSNYTVGQIQDLIDESGEVPAVNQIEMSPFGYSEEMLEFCRDNNITIQAYSPLTRGERLDDDTLVEIAEKHGKTSAQVMIRWCIEMGAVPIPKANDIAHASENLDVFDFELDKDDMESLCSLNEEFSALGRQLAYI